MRTHIWLNDSGKKTFLCIVDLEVVPGGTYIIDDTPYRLSDKPTFIIGGEDRSGLHSLQRVELTVEKIPEGI